MARGSNNISLDAKGRVSIPTKHRADFLSAAEGRLVITVSPNDRCLFLYTLPVWETVEKELTALPSLNVQARKLKRMMVGHANDCEMDGQGRVLIPAPLREFAMISKKAVMVGQGDKFEIWDDALWTEHRDAIYLEEIDESALPPEMQNLSF